MEFNTHNFGIIHFKFKFILVTKNAFISNFFNINSNYLNLTFFKSNPFLTIKVYLFPSKSTYTLDENLIII